MSSLAEARAGLAAAINGIDGLQYFAQTPGTPRVGDSWLRWSAERDGDAGGIEITWSIAVVTPQDETAADAWIDDRIDDLLAALRPVTYVTGYAPARLEPPGASPIIGLLITTNRE